MASEWMKRRTVDAQRRVAVLEAREEINLDQAIILDAVAQIERLEKFQKACQDLCPDGWWAK